LVRDYQILVLIEESAAALLTRSQIFSYYLVASRLCFSTMVYDCLGIWISSSLQDMCRTMRKFKRSVRSAIQPIAETLGLGQREFRQDVAAPTLAKQWVLANQKPLFSIDLSINHLNQQFSPQDLVNIIRPRYYISLESALVERGVINQSPSALDLCGVSPATLLPCKVSNHYLPQDFP
jgi:hypothetical protein